MTGLLQAEVVMSQGGAAEKLPIQRKKGNFSIRRMGKSTSFPLFALMITWKQRKKNITSEDCLKIKGSGQKLFKLDNGMIFVF